MFPHNGHRRVSAGFFPSKLVVRSRVHKYLITGLLALGSLLVTQPVFAGAEDLTPDSVFVTLAPGQSYCETKTADVNGFIPRGDILFAFDMSNSMAPVVSQVKTDALAIMSNLSAVFGDVRFGVCSYTDYPGTFSSCGYNREYGWTGGDYPYFLDQPLTGNTTDVSTAIGGLTIVEGRDLPESYTRVCYESYSDDNIGFRPEAKKILLNFGDHVPHDCNVEEGISFGIWSTGKDPGRDGLLETGDDLDLQTVLGEMFDNNRTLLEVHRTADYEEYWDYWTGITGGQVFVLNDIIEDVGNAIQQMVEDEANLIELLTLELCEPGYEAWLTSVEPAQYTNVMAPATVGFDLVLTVPPGTPDGVYSFRLCAIGDGAVMGEQYVEITVVGNHPPVAVCQDMTVEADANCLAEASIDNGSSDPDGDPIIITQDPAGPYTLGETVVTLIVQDNPLPFYDDCAEIDITLPALADTCEATVTVVDNTSPVCTVPNDTSVFMCEPTELCLPVGCTDNCDGDPTITVASGPGEIVDGDWCYTPSGNESFTVNTFCVDESSNSCGATFEVSVTMNRTPSISCPENIVVHWGDYVSATATASDPDDDDLTFSLGSGSPGAINPATGEFTWQTTGSDVCVNEIEVIVTDECGATSSCTFLVSVQNDPPVISCGDDNDTAVVWGDVVVGQVTATDPDGGPYAPFYSLVSFDGPGMVIVNPATGEFTWETAEELDFLGTFELCLTVTDSAEICDQVSPRNADTCCFEILVMPSYRIYIEKTHETLQGQYEYVSIYMDSSYTALEMGGYNFLVDYDASVLNFHEALPGQLLMDCDWEYFTYRYGPNGNCGPSACPTGKLRVVAMAEQNNGEWHPVCFTNEPGVSGELAELVFLVSNDRNLECQYVPIRFYWYECGDNTLSSEIGDTLYISRHVYAYDNPIPIDHPDVSFPTYRGANSTCDVSDKTAPRRRVDFFFGGIDIVCADSIDARGDINVNGIAYEIADAVMLANYFVRGLDAFYDHVEASIAASDANADGIPLSVADLVWLIRVVVGDADPYPKVEPTAATFSVEDGVVTVDQPMGAACATYAGDVTPVLLADNVEMIYGFDGRNTRVLVYGLEAGAAFQGGFLQADGDLLNLEMATYDGSPVAAKALPSGYSLSQNYPNPFNPVTSISFNLPHGGHWNLSIYNVKGQMVAEFTGNAEPGLVTQTWDGAAHASGVFFYRLDTDEFTSTRKMILLK